jgi:hypothetical protein
MERKLTKGAYDQLIKGLILLSVLDNVKNEDEKDNLPKEEIENIRNLVQKQLDKVGKDELESLLEDFKKQEAIMMKRYNESIKK